MRSGDAIAGPDSQPVRITEAGSDAGQLATIGRNLHHSLLGMHEIKVTERVGLQAGDVIVSSG